MTIKDAILAFPGFSDLDETLVDKTLIDRTVNGAATYQGETPAFCLVIADLSKHAASLPDFSESGLSIKVSRGALLQQASDYAKKGGASNYDISDGTHKW